MNAILATNTPPSPTSAPVAALGSVSLVGAGPGAKDLLTLRAVEALAHADVVYYDSLVDDAVLDFVPDAAACVFVGKRKGFSALPQQDIQDHMRNDALAVKTVFRLKGGDPFIFGRGGEELQDLHGYGFSVDVVPGVTSATAAAAVAVIPLTHRDVATSVTLATGYTTNGDVPDLTGLASSDRTFVFYMGISNAPKIASQLRHSGSPGTTPVAVIEQATLPGQRIIHSTIDALEADLRTQNIGTPALLIVGDVTALGAPKSDPLIPLAPSPEPANDFAWVHHPMG